MKDYKTTIYEHNGEDRLTIDFEEQQITLSCREAMTDRHLEALLNAIDGVIYARNEALTEE
jgi:hypothetical protein